MRWATIYGPAWSILKETPRVCKTHARFLGFGGIVWLALLPFWHRFDYPLETWIQAHRNPFWQEVARQASHWGELQFAPLGALLIIALVGFFLKNPRLYWSALTGALAGVIAGILVNVFKGFFGRPRPSTDLADGIYWFHWGWAHASFPSGHSTHCSAVAMAVSLLAPRAGIVLWAGGFFVMWSRWYSERHYLTDVWGGAGLGIAIGLTIGWATRAVLAERRERSRSMSAPEASAC